MPPYYDSLTFATPVPLLLEDLENTNLENDLRSDEALSNENTDFFVDDVASESEPDFPLEVFPQGKEYHMEFEGIVSKKKYKNN